MEIIRIAVESFRSHDKFEVPLAKLTVITGPNGSGKSTILEAASTVLLGENTWTSRDGIKLPSLIKRGAKQAKVTIVGKRAISRIITPKGSKVVLDDKDPLTQFELLSNLKVTEQQVRAALIPTAFLQLPIKDQKDALFGILGVSLKIEQMKKYIPAEAMPTWIKIETRWIEDHSTPAEEGEEAPPLPPVDLDKLYKTVYQARTNYKAKTSPTSPKNEDHDRLVQELDDVSAKIAKANYQDAQRKATEKEIARIPELEKKVLQLASKAPAAMDDFETKNAAAIAEFEAADLKRAELSRECEKLEKELQQFNKAKVESGKKVICPIGLECPHDEASLKSRKTYVGQQFTAKSKEHDAAAATLAKAEQAHRDLLAERKAAEQGKKEYEQAQADLVKAKELKAEAGKTPAPDLAALQKEKARIGDALKAAAAGATPPEKDPTVDHLDQIVKALDVNGIKTQLILQGVAELEKEANAVFSKFGPYSIRFFLDQEYRPAILQRDAEIQIGELSEGERLIASLVIQDVFAQRSRVNLVVIDNADLLDPSAYAKFVRTCMTLKSKVLVGLANQGHDQGGLPNDGPDYSVVSLAPKPDKGSGPKKAGGGKKPLEEIL